MAVFTKEETTGTMGTMAITRVTALGAGEAPVVTGLAVMHRGNAGVPDKGGILGMEMEQTTGRERHMRTD